MEHYVAAADIGGTNLRLALARVPDAGSLQTIVARSSTSTVGVRDPKHVVTLIRDGIGALLSQAGVPRTALKAVAAGAGIVNFDTGVVIVTSYLLGWRDVPLRSLLEQAIGVPAAVDNDVNLAALGESWAGVATNTADFVFLAIGTGLGAGIVLNGRPFRGLGWTAGEIGYMLLPGLPKEPAPRGQPGGLEGILGGEGIKALWQSRWSSKSTPLPRDLHATELFDHALHGDPLAKGVLAQAGDALASAVYNISLVLNCPLFVLGGGVGSHPAIRAAAQDVLRKWGSRVNPAISTSTLGPDAQLFGAIRLALTTASDRAHQSIV